MTKDYVAVDRNGYVATIKLNNPPTHTINAQGSEDLLEALEAISTDHAVRVVVLTGASDDIFVRHYEVGELAVSAERATAQRRPRPPTRTPSSNVRQPRGLRGAMWLLESMNAITIAAINGMAMGGGLELALACDFRLLRSGEYRLGLPETGVGILPGGGGTQRLARLIGMGKALDLILHGQVFDPNEALRLGIVSRLLPNELTEFIRSVNEFAENLAQRAPVALANAKRAIREGIELPLSEGLQREAELFGELMRTEDAAKALRAAFSGEPMPDFKGQ